MCIGASPAGVRRAHRVNSVNSDTDSLWDSRRRIPTGLEALPEGELHLRLVPPPVVTRGRVQQTAQHPCPRKSILTLRGWPGQAGGPSSRRGGARICRTSSLLGGSSCGPCRRFCRPGWHGGRERVAVCRPPDARWLVAPPCGGGAGRAPPRAEASSKGRDQGGPRVEPRSQLECDADFYYEVVEN